MLSDIGATSGQIAAVESICTSRGNNAPVHAILWQGIWKEPTSFTSQEVPANQPETDINQQEPPKVNQPEEFQT